MSLSLKLQDFGGDAGLRPSRGEGLKLEAAREEGYQEGFEEGRAAARAEIDEEDRATLAQTLERLRDIELSAAGARAEAETRLRPVLDALIRAVAPAAARAGLAEAVAEAVQARLSAAASAPPTLSCAPERVAALSARLGEAVEITPDPALGAGAARVDWRGGGVSYDADSCAAAALAALGAFFGESDEEPEACPKNQTIAG